MEENLKEVRFDLYCPKCKHENLQEGEDPCYDCLNEPSNYASHKPVKFTPKK